MRKRQERSLTTVRSYHTHLSAAFEVARRWEYIDKNPFRMVKRVKPPESTPIFVTKQQFELLMRLTDDQDLKDVLLTAVMTGMRLGELMALRWEEVNLAGRTILVRCVGAESNVRHAESRMQYRVEQNVVPDGRREALNLQRTDFNCQL